MGIDRVVVFSGDPRAYSVRRGIAEICERRPQVSVLVLEHRPPRPLARLLRNQWRALRRDGVRHVVELGREVSTRAWSRAVGSPAVPEGAPGASYEMSALEASGRVRVIQAGDIHSSVAQQAVREFGPDLGLSLAAPILKPELFEIPRLGTINLHKGRVPHYRGMPPAFWEIWNAEVEVGCTVHRVERGLDTGDIVTQSCVPVERHSTIRGLQIRLDELGIRLVADAVDAIADGTATFTAQAPGGKTWRKPTLAQWSEVRHREPGRVAPTLREWLKEGVYAGYVCVLRPLPRILRGLLGRQRVTVLLYHRVSDEMRDALTVGVAQFERQMAAIRRHCTVVGIDAITAGRVDRRSLRPIVAVTFDDGYRDNHDNAAPILLRHRVPAAFFVSTALIGSDRGFPHDLAKLGRALPAMNWDDIARLRRQGFVIGSHTESHINCARGDRDAVAGEITASRRTLEERLGETQLIFAYPYGGRGDFNDEWRGFVRQAGYVACLSAYGGTHEREVDPYDVRRTGVNHGFGPWAFRARTEGWA